MPYTPKHFFDVSIMRSGISKGVCSPVITRGSHGIVPIRLKRARATVVVKTGQVTRPARFLQASGEAFSGIRTTGNDESVGRRADSTRLPKSKMLETCGCTYIEDD